VKPAWKHIIASACALLIVAYMVFALKMSGIYMPQPVCKHLIITIGDSENRQLVNCEQLRHLIASKGLNPIGKSTEAIALQTIENMVKQHEMVRDVECYHTMGGDVVVRVQQRVPLVYVQTQYENYTIDTDRKIMPPVMQNASLLVTGNVSHRMAQNELYDFALWLQQHPYWYGHISRVEVVSPHMVELTDQRHHAAIVLGDWRGYDKKLNKLQHFYELGQQLDLEKYQKVDVRFRGQVIGVN